MASTATEKTWTFYNKSKWGKGEWQNEADKYFWVDPDTNLPCLIVRNPLGALCGYVGISEGHPLYGVNLPDDIECHGGVTFSDFHTTDNKQRGVYYDHEFGKSDKLWWIGFDCCHAWDLAPNTPESLWIGRRNGQQTYRTVEYVKEQVRSLAQQLHGLPQ